MIFLILQGDSADNMYFIIKGKVSVRMLSAVSIHLYISFQKIK